MAGDHQAAAAHARDALRWGAWLHAATWLSSALHHWHLVEALLAAGAGGEAQRAVDLLVPLAEEGPRYQVPLEPGVAALARRRGDDQGPGHLEAVCSWCGELNLRAKPGRHSSRWRRPTGSSFTLTMDVYSHVTPTLQREALERLGDLLEAQP